MQKHIIESVIPDDVLLESLPDYIEAHREAYARWLRAQAAVSGELEFVTADLERWTPGQVLRVAFLGGTTDLHEKIVGAVGDIAAVCNIHFDFGRDAATGIFRGWSQQDKDYAAEIRVSFDRPGYFSLVGTESASPIGAHADLVGGFPWQRSLNLGGFDRVLPPQWRGTVLHEFLHALAFHHEHQNRRGPCQDSFRWEDDSGYLPTRDARGAFMPDPQGRRPGIYTYLSGFPNFWPRAKIDRNLRAPTDPNLTFGDFDAASVMLYRFPPLFYREQPSPCAPSGDGQSLSAGDIHALQRLYPRDPATLSGLAARTAALLATLPEGSLEDPSDEFVYAKRAYKILNRKANALRATSSAR